MIIGYLPNGPNNDWIFTEIFFFNSIIFQDSKMVRYLQSDARYLSEDAIRDIIKARSSMKRASEVMADKYRISSRRVYQI